MSTPADRLRQIIENEGITPRQWALKYSVPYNGFMQILKGNQPFGMTLIEKTLEVYPNIDMNWLLKGSQKYDTQLKIDTPVVAESSSEYNAIDHFEEMLIKYLDRDSIKEKIKEILKK